MDNQNPENQPDKSTEVKIGKDVSESVIVTGNQNVINLTPPKKPRQTPKPRKKKPLISNPTIAVALIAFSGTVIAALLTSPLLVKWAEPTPTPTSTVTITPTEVVTATEYLTATPFFVVVTSTEVPVTPPTPTFTPTFTPTPIFIPTLENTATESPSPVPLVNRMTAVLQSTLDEGKAPLTVTFDARASQIQFPDGSKAPCGNNSFCSYVFAIYRNSKLVERFITDEGALSYTFGVKGQYFVTVYVCRGEACNDDGVTVNVK